MLDIALFFLACVGIHRIWNYEEIFRSLRTWVQRKLPTLGKPVFCQACNPFWIALFLALLVLPFDWKRIVLVVFSSYAVVRGVSWFYQLAPRVGMLLSMVGQQPQHQQPPSRPPHAGGCGRPGGGCGGQKEALIAKQAEALSHDKRIVMLTTFLDFNPAYSLCTVVLDHATALGRLHPAWKIEVWVMQTADEASWPKTMPPNVVVRKVVPAVPWKDDALDEKVRAIIKDALIRELLVLGNATIITHDWIHQAAYISGAAAIHDIGATKGFKWLHVCHSGPGERPKEEIAQYRSTLPNGDHTLVVLSKSQVEGFKRMYQTERIAVLPNSRSLLTIFPDERIQQLAFKYGLEEANIIQTYPFSTPRAEAKGVPFLLEAFKHLPNSRLILANCHANGHQDLAKSWKRDGVIVISEEFPDLAVHGLSSQQVALLFQLSSLFIFPTTAEASSLILLEAALAGNALALNEQVPSLFDMVPHPAWRFNPAFESPRALAERVMLTRRSEILQRHSLLALARRLEALV